VLASALLLLAFPVWAQDEAPAELPAPTSFVQQQAQSLLDIANRAVEVGTEGYRLRQTDMKAAVRGFIDYGELCRRSLGDHWDARSEEERTQFVELMTRLIETNYTVKMGDNQVGNDFTVTYTDEMTRDHYARVSGTVAAGEKTSVFEMLMMQRDGHWIIFDVVTDDVSIQETYAESFDEIIRDEGWDALIQRIEDRIAELETELEQQANGG